MSEVNSITSTSWIHNNVICSFACKVPSSSTYSVLLCNTQSPTLCHMFKAILGGCIQCPRGIY
ncbi:hypothetical protein C8R48DRAFT_738599, partial [Suillus tomentosus]